MKRIIFLLLISLVFISGCNNKVKNDNADETKNKEARTIGIIERLDPVLDKIIPKDAKIEVLADGFGWTEGPLWIPDGNYIIFSDIPPNTIYKWKEGEGVSIYLTPSGYTGKEPYGPEPGLGSNGLILDPQNNLVICQHGDRRMARMDAPLNSPEPKYTTIADNYKGKKLNSPNDAVYNKKGDLYFTDPPYGFAKEDKDPAKEMSFNGVYKTDSQGNTELLTDKLSRPNGIAFSPDEKTLYVSNTETQSPIIMAYDVEENGMVKNGRVFFDATNLLGEGVLGLPDGMKVNKEGYVFASGPGGILIISPIGKHIGTINPGVEVANCAFGGDGYLYLAANMYLTRVKLF